mmetsp:Transcript_125658/g.305241  ORF Transcript_125658/g.305241 Transcript_125658/m.305241 type:complete len:240 (+) Transcript_125658:230-949(+)
MLEGPQDPVAVWRDPGLVVHLVLVLSLVSSLQGFLLALLGRQPRDRLLQAQLLGLQVRLELLRNPHGGLVLQLGGLLVLHAVPDLVGQVFDEHREDGDNVLRLTLAGALARERGVGGLELRDLEVGLLLLQRKTFHRALDRPHLDLVLRVVPGQDRLGLVQQLDGGLVLPLGREEVLVLRGALCGHGLHLVLHRLDVGDGLRLLRVPLLDHVLDLDDLGLIVPDLPLQVSDLAGNLLIL